MSKKTGRRTPLWMPLHIADYQADTQHLDAAEHGAYVLFLMHAWVHDGKLPKDETQLRRIGRMDAKTWNRSKPVLLAFFNEVDGYYHSHRLDAELIKSCAIINQKSAAGKASAKQRAMQRKGNEKATSVEQPLNENDIETELQEIARKHTSDSQLRTLDLVDNSKNINKINNTISTDVEFSLQRHSNQLQYIHKEDSLINRNNLHTEETVYVEKIEKREPEQVDLCPADAVQKKKKTKAKRDLTQVPEDWTPPRDWIQAAKQKYADCGLKVDDVDIRLVGDQLVAWLYTNKNGATASVKGTWNTFIANDITKRRGGLLKGFQGLSLVGGNNQKPQNRFLDVGKKDYRKGIDENGRIAL